MKSRTKVLSLLLLFVCFFCLPSSCCAAAEPTYTITEQELTTLENNLSKLAQICEKQSSELKTLKATLEMSGEELTELQEQLRQSKQALTELQAELTALRETTKAQEQLLQIANKSLETYAREVKAERRRLKAQRGLSYLLTVAAVVFAVM